MKSKKNLIIIALVIAISLLGITYAFFDYYKLGVNQKITAGKVNLVLNEGTDTIDISNVFPETATEARSRSDNEITFTISGANTTTNHDIYYEIMLNEGDSETGMTRFDPEDLVFDLIEVDDNGNDVYVVNALSFSDFNEKRIWVNTIVKGIDTAKTRTYKLRMWLSEDVLISDSASNADYPATGYENYYASVKVSVYGDFVEKSIPYNYLACYDSSSFWPTAISDQKDNISEIHFISLTLAEINSRVTASSISADVTDASLGGSVKAWLETDTTDATKYIMYVASEGTTYFPSDCSLMFNDFAITSIIFENIDTSKVEDMLCLFSYCEQLKNLDISDWDVSNVKVMEAMFYNCQNLQTLIFCTSTGKVLSFQEMFANCSSLTNLDMKNCDTSSVENMSSMFLNCEALEYIDIGSWNVENVNDMNNMFACCFNLKSLNFNKWDTSNVVNMNFLFLFCSSLTSLDLSNWNTSKVTDMSGMFSDCSNLTSLNIRDFTFDNIESFETMFFSMPDSANITVGGTKQQNWVLALTSPDSRPTAWTTSNVVVKS